MSGWQHIFHYTTATAAAARLVPDRSMSSDSWCSKFKVFLVTLTVSQRLLSLSTCATLDKSFVKGGLAFAETDSINGFIL